MYEEITKLLEMLAASGKNYDIEKIKRAFLYAKELHEGQFRNSGEPYICHPVAVAEIVAELGLDTDSICAALLHDTIEDCGSKVDLEKITTAFGSDVAMLVDGLTKLVQLSLEDKEEKHIENLRKMLLAMSKDVRVIFIKLCDRLHNMRTLDAKPEGKRRQTALETMYVYAPLAHRLGMQRIKQELENLSISYLDPIGYKEVRTDIEKKYGMNRDFIERAKATVSEKLSESGIPFTLDGRVKTVYSVYKKMYEQNKSFDEIYDFYALRIIVETELECYTVLGLIHDMFKSMPGRFKDYISTPKPNLYRSLHTTVIGRDGIPFEVQIRTREMHEIAEYGVAAHWKYKSGEQSSADIDKKLSWISRLLETENETRDPDEFLDALKIDIFQDETFVFTPKGDVINLPQGATAIDFAYSIHSGVGNHMVGAKINGMIVPIDRVLKNGEIVEILTSQNSKGPSRDWLKIVRTGQARYKIRQWFKKEKRSENIAVGRAELDRMFRRSTPHCSEAQRLEIVTALYKRFNASAADDFYNMIGYGAIPTAKLTRTFRDEFDRVVRPEATEQEPQCQEQTAHPAKKAPRSSVIVDGVDGCAVKFAHCCNPLPGDELIGFVTKGYGISVHKRQCPHAVAGLQNPAYEGRWIPVHWNLSDREQQSERFEATVVMIAENRMTLIADVSALLADMHVSLLRITTQPYSANETMLQMVVSVRDTEHVKSILTKMRSIRGALRVSRG